VSAFGGKADMAFCTANVCFRLKADMRKIDGEFIGRARLVDYGSQGARPCRSAELISAADEVIE